MIIGISKTLSSVFQRYSPHFERAYCEVTFIKGIILDRLLVSEHVDALAIHRDLVTILICP
jgi:hypothetical protein